MIYPAEIEHKLGFDQLRTRLKNYCLSPATTLKVDALVFSVDLQPINTWLLQNLEFKMILESGEDFPSRHFFDPSLWLQKIALEGDYLDEPDLLQLANSLETIISCKGFLQKNKEKYPTLFSLTLPVALSAQLEQMIRAVIDDSATVKDSASDELRSIRRKLRDEQARLRKLSDQMYRMAVAEKWVPEGALPTIREGRVVIPILAEHKRKLKGFVLDESATGQTVFMEPAEMLDANNAIRELEHAERREVIRILKALTAKLRADQMTLSTAFEFLSEVDFIRAKGKLSVELQAELPIVNNAPALTWYQAKHPLLYLNFKNKREVVPLDIELHDANHMLLVSGPNAGGKSVALKTVGLLQYMMQCGLLVPLSDRSRMGIFNDIFLDIGDQQSIENDLSTYSSHLQNMAAFLKNTSSKSLILIDELGSGTDPNFGGAIAQAVLVELLKRKSWGVVTTHYYNLKLFAGHEQGIRNAAMRFDDKNLVPLYILDIGKPGSSFALEIAKKTGLPQTALEEAERLVGKELAGFETLVREMDRERQELLEKSRKMAGKQQELDQSLQKYKSLSADLELRKKEIIEKAKQEAQQLLKETNREIEKTIRHIRENKAEKKETLKVRNNLRNLSQKVVQEKALTVPSGPLKEGDHVRIIGQQGSGVIQSVKGKNAIVQFGELKSLVDLSKLEKTTAKVPEKSTTTPARSTGLSIHEKRVSFNNTLDVRGKRVEEVMPLLEQFMDTAILLGQGELKILHGKGEGVLRKIVREQLKRYKEVASFGDEHVERGGDGITVVVLKE